MIALSLALQGQPGVSHNPQSLLVWVASCGWHSMENILQSGCSETWGAYNAMMVGQGAPGSPTPSYWGPLLQACPSVMGGV